MKFGLSNVQKALMAAATGAALTLVPMDAAAQSRGTVVVVTPRENPNPKIVYYDAKALRPVRPVNSRVRNGGDGFQVSVYGNSNGDFGVRAGVKVGGVSVGVGVSKTGDSSRRRRGPNIGF